MSRDKMQTRSITSDLKTRAEEKGKFIEGYFAVFDTPTELWAGAYEEIDANAFNETLENDIRALINHDSTLVVGRNKANTLDLKVDGHGLWGKIAINENDSEAINLYARVERGDVSGCSFGYNILDEETEWREDGTVKWTLKKIDLHEVSCCTFPAYPQTGIQARHDEVEKHKKRQIEHRKNTLKERLKDA